uniref:Uncharacterized protein n=1 Tax=Hanusia phi TaxID=3032 RepID=A0A7S0HN11_9CRYP|mmetsp:Transcript_25878/g.58311  ORF Transcript_25878/g.58311 Transcript_25878/m.58311 type:complete len:346 (+) Transcript_25878:84-1121(+)
MHHTSADSAKWIPPLCLSADADLALQQSAFQQLGKLFGFGLAALSAACLLRMHAYAVKEDMLPQMINAQGSSGAETSRKGEVQEDPWSSTAAEQPSDELTAARAGTEKLRVRLGATRRDPQDVISRYLRLPEPPRLPGMLPTPSDRPSDSAELCSFRSIEQMTDDMRHVTVMELHKQIKETMDTLQSLQLRLFAMEGVSSNEETGQETVSCSSSLGEQDTSGFYTPTGKAPDMMLKQEESTNSERSDEEAAGCKSPRSVENRSEASTLCSVQTNSQHDFLFLDGVPMHQSLQHCQEADDFIFVHQQSRETGDSPAKEGSGPNSANSVQTFFQTVMSKSFAREIHF